MCSCLMTTLNSFDPLLMLTAIVTVTLAIKAITLLNSDLMLGSVFSPTLVALFFYIWSVSDSSVN